MSRSHGPRASVVSKRRRKRQSPSPECLRKRRRDPVSPELCQNIRLRSRVMCPRDPSKCLDEKPSVRARSASRRPCGLCIWTGNRSWAGHASRRRHKHVRKRRSWSRRTSGAGQAFQESLSEDGSHLYTISQRSSASTPAGQGNVLHTLVIQSDGTVSETAPPVDFNQPGGARPQGVAVVDR
jgi:hypothetical protein